MFPVETKLISPSQALSMVAKVERQAPVLGYSTNHSRYSDKDGNLKVHGMGELSPVAFTFGAVQAMKSWWEDESAEVSCTSHVSDDYFRFAIISYLEAAKQLPLYAYSDNATWQDACDDGVRSAMLTHWLESLDPWSKLRFT